MATILEVRNIRCFDGLHYSFELLSYFHSNLHPMCCEIIDDNAKVIPALACAWGFVDALHRIREISQSLPRLGDKHPEMRAFLSATALAEDYRHYIQHLRGELSKDPPNGFPVWGSLSWVDDKNEAESHIALFGAQIEGTGYSGCVYDRLEKKWVSKVCLGVGHRSFNFDKVYDSVLRFKEFVLPFVIEGASEEIKLHNKLPIMTMEYKMRAPDLPDNRL
ncbi:MAG: hypothetical protein IID51_11425 [Proteobacteria bacterium]|nr:hypothetical protein [Pseudomonadota bacterium]